MVFNNVLFGIVYYMLVGQSIIGNRFISISVDPNYYAVVILLAISLICLYINSYKANKVIIPLLVILVFFGLLSGSRMFIIGLLLPTLYILRVLFFSQKGRKLFFVICFAVIIIVSLWKHIYPYLELVFVRLNSETTISGNGRIDAWNYYYSQWIETIQSFLLGKGKQLPYYSNGNNAVLQHNLYLEALSEIGLIGTICYFGTLCSIFTTIKKKPVPVFSYLPIAVLLLCYSSLNALFSETSTMLFVLSFIGIELLAPEKTRRIIIHGDRYERTRTVQEV